MLYNQPWDQPSVPNAPYINGNPGAGIQGSIPSAAAIEQPQREITNLITAAGLTPSNSDQHQLGEAVQSSVLNYGVDTGAANALVVALPSAPLAYVSGLIVRVKAAYANTGATTINVNGLGLIAVKRANGAALSANDITAGMIVVMVYDSVAGVFQVMNFGGYTVSATNNNNYIVGIPYAVDTGAVNALVALFNPVIASLTAGLTIEVKVTNTNTGAATLAVNSNAAAAILDGYGQALTAGVLNAGSIVQLVYNGTAFQFNRFCPRVYNWDAASPPVSGVSLFPEDRAYVTFENVTAVDLNSILLSPGRYRVLFVITASNSQNSDLSFYVNGANYPNAFSSKQIAGGGYGSTNWTNNSGFNFDLWDGDGAPSDAGPFMLDLHISTVTKAKFLRGVSIINGGPAIFSGFWQDTTTVWSTLGKLYVGQSFNGGNPGPSDAATISGFALVQRKS